MMSVDVDLSARNISSGTLSLLPSVSLCALKDALIHAKWQSSWSLPSCASVNNHLPTCSFFLLLRDRGSGILLKIDDVFGSAHARSFPATMKGICSNELKLEHLSETIQIVSKSAYRTRIKSSCADSPVIASSSDWLEDCE
jgi:hypothetical protein